MVSGTRRVRGWKKSAMLSAKVLEVAVPKAEFTTMS